MLKNVPFLPGLPYPLGMQMVDANQLSLVSHGGDTVRLDTAAGGRDTVHQEKLTTSYILKSLQSNMIP